MLNYWLARARIESRQIEQGDKLYQAFEALLKYIWSNEYRGACHDTSAVLYIVLTEMGVDSELCIGEVGFRDKFFDHSWVEVNGKIYDAAVSLPKIGGQSVGPAVFASLDLDTGEETTLVYGAASGVGFGGEAAIVVDKTLVEYSKIQPSPNIWQLAELVAQEIGMKFAKQSARKKYGHITRSLRVPV